MAENKCYERLQLINTDTGEILGNAIIDPQKDTEVKLVVENKTQSKAYKEKLENENSIIEHIQDNEGSFIHLIYKYSEPFMRELQEKCEGSKANIHIIRFIILSTYLTFNKKLFDNNKNEIKKSSLGKIWDTKSRNSINETYKILKECNYIYEDEKGNIMLNDNIVIKGAVENFKKLKREDENLTYTRAFAKNLQNMYEGTDPKSRKQLANLFKLLPYVNFTHNVLCMNPSEEDHKKLKLMSWCDVARACGIDTNKNLTRFKNELFKLKIYDKCVVGQFICSSSKTNYKICINPKVFYAGNNIEDLKALYRLFEM